MKKIVTMSKARQLYEILKQDISQGKYADDPRLPSIRSLAEEYELSKNTVNTAIAMLVSEGFAVVREGNGTYVIQTPQKSRMIGIMMFDFTVGTQVESMILSHIQRNIPQDYYLSLVNTSDRYDVFCNGLEHLISAGAAGLLIVPPSTNPTSDAEMERIKTLLNQVPTVFINRSIPGIEKDTFSMDLKKGVQTALEYFQTTGKERTAIVLHNSAKFLQEELDAYEEFTKAYGLKQNPNLLIPHTTVEEVRDRLQTLSGQFDSLIAPDGVMVQITDIIAANGLEIPRELSLVGINNTLLSGIHNPPLTSISFPVERIGKNAILQLIRRIEETDPHPIVYRNYPPDFIIRKT